jgi:hypothetical protein
MKRPLGEIAKVRMGFAFRARLEPDAKGNCAVVQMKDIDDQDLLHSEGLARVHIDSPPNIVRKGDVIFKSRGARNTASVVAADLGIAIIAAPLMLIRVTDIAVHPSYLQWILNHPSTQQRLDVMPVSTTGRMISTTALRELVIDLPSLDCQERILAIHTLQAKDAQLAKTIASLRKSLCDELLLRYATDNGPTAG